MKTTKRLLLLLIFSLTILSSRAQTIGITINSNTLCNTSNSTAILFTITNTYTGTAGYSISINSSCGNYGIAYYLSTTGIAFVTCTGPFTLICTAIGSSSNIIAAASINATVVAPSMTVSPNNGAVCSGNQVFVNLGGTGAPNFTTLTSPVMGISNQSGTSFSFTPSASGCYTVLSAANGCSAVTTKCFTVSNTPIIATNTLVTVCSNLNSVNLSASGANSYTWSTGSFTNTATVPASVSACYTVSGSSPGCTGTATAVVCVNSIAAPAYTANISGNAFCVGTPINLNAGGAATYTWIITNTGSTVNPLFTSTLSNVTYTPPLGFYTVNLTTGNNSTCFGNSTFTFSALSQATLNVPAFVNMCSGSSVNLNAFGATNYTWSNGSNSSNITVSPFVNTCYTVTGINAGCGTSNSSVVCVTIIAATPVNIVGPTTICAGSTNVYTAVGGGGSYFWTSVGGALGSGSVCTISNYSGCIVVVNTNSAGCVSNNTLCPTILPSPNLIVSGFTNTLCGIAAQTVTASGANSYTWLPSGVTGNVFIYTPTSLGCYTVRGSNNSGNGCVSSYVWCINSISSPPNLNVIGPTTLCQGANGLLTANGAINYYWNTGSTSNTILINQTSSTCYTVIGDNNSICSSTVVYCVNSSPQPTLQVIGNNTVCYGSAVSFTASGGNFYSWNNNTSGSTFSTIPTSNFNLNVLATHSLNSCITTSLIAVTVNTGCATVWPGDANRDGVVSNSDVFEIGLASGSSGPGRVGGSNAWTAQNCIVWSGTVSSGWNKAHADCNGDGNITAADTVAIFNNFSLTHAFKNTNSTSGIDLFLIPHNSEAFGGIWNVIDVVLGDVSNTQSQIYGAAFDINYDQSMIMPDSVKLIYTNSFLNNGNQNIQFRKNQFTNGKLYAASVRTDQSDVSGFSKIGELRVKLRSDLADNSSFVFGISNGLRTNAAGNMGILSTSGSMNLNVNNNATGIQEKFVIKNLVNFYPNPANQNIIIQCNSGTKTNFRLLDITGRCVMTGDVTGIKSLDISTIQQGVYVFEFDTQNGKIQKKLIKE